MRIINVSASCLRYAGLGILILFIAMMTMLGVVYTGHLEREMSAYDKVYHRQTRQIYTLLTDLEMTVTLRSSL